MTGSLPQTAAVQQAPPVQKVTPVQTPSASGNTASVAPVPPAPAPPPPPPQERQRADPKVPVEPDAVIYSQFAQDFALMSELAHFVRASGYRCDSISALEPHSGGYTLVCNHANYKYAIEDKNGRSIVTVK